MGNPIRNTHDHELLSDRLLDLADKADALCHRIGGESADANSPELDLLRAAVEQAEDLGRTLRKAAEVARENGK